MKKIRKYFYPFISILGVCIIIQHLQACDRKESPEFVKKELFIKFKSDISTQSIQTFVNENNLEIIRKYPQIKVLLFNIRDERDVLSVCKELNEDPLVEYAEPNFIVHE